MAAILVSIYIAMFLGSVSPIHCRCIVALATIASMALSFSAAFGLLYYCGFHTSTFHLWLPFLVISIGADHAFVMCNAVD